MNNNSKFAHLHLHTEHSTLDGYGSARQFVDQAIELGFKYLAITDRTWI
jgi:DNA polymerase III alpha subunit